MFFCRFVQWYIYCKQVFCYLFIALSNKAPGLCSIYALSMYSDGGWVAWLCLTSSMSNGIQVPQTKCSYLDWIVTECGMLIAELLFCPSREFFVHIRSSPMRSCNVIPFLGVFGHWEVKVLSSVAPIVTRRDHPRKLVTFTAIVEHFEMEIFSLQIYHRAIAAEKPFSNVCFFVFKLLALKYHCKFINPA